MALQIKGDNFIIKIFPSLLERFSFSLWFFSQYRHIFYALFLCPYIIYIYIFCVRIYIYIIYIYIYLLQWLRTTNWTWTQISFLDHFSSIILLYAVLILSKCLCVCFFYSIISPFLIHYLCWMSVEDFFFSSRNYDRLLSLAPEELVCFNFFFKTQSIDENKWNSFCLTSKKANEVKKIQANQYGGDKSCWLN